MRRRSYRPVALYATSVLDSTPTKVTRVGHPNADHVLLPPNALPEVLGLRAPHTDDTLPAVVRAGLLHVGLEAMPPYLTATDASVACSSPAARAWCSTWASSSNATVRSTNAASTRCVECRLEIP